MQARCTETTILVEGLTVDAYVGQYYPERREKQVVRIDLSCTLAEPEVAEDRIAHTFNYVPIIKGIRELAVAERRRLIEIFAEEIAELCFADAKIQSVVVSVRKPNKFSDSDAVGITRTFERRNT